MDHGDQIARDPADHVDKLALHRATTITLLLLSIADINLLFKPERSIRIGYSQKDFIQVNPPSPPFTKGCKKGIIDCILSVEEHNSPFNIKGKNIFSHDGPWRLYRSRDGYKIAFLSPPSAPGCYMLAELKKDFSRGKLYVKYGRKKTFIVSHPLDQLLVINLLSRGRGVMLHSCCVNDNRRGFLYVGTSRSGKSTTAKLWLKESDATVLSDDRIIIRKMDGKFYAYGTPWHGEVNVCDPGRVEIEKIFFLRHSDKNYVKSLSPVDSATRMFVCSFPTFWDKDGMAFTLSFIDEIVKGIPCYEFGFVPDKSVVEFVRRL